MKIFYFNGIHIRFTAKHKKRAAQRAAPEKIRVFSKTKLTINH